MSIGTSGRIVIEIEPESKRQLYAALARDGLTLKDWFLRNVEHYMTASSQFPLTFSKDASKSALDTATEQAAATSVGGQG